MRRQPLAAYAVGNRLMVMMSWLPGVEPKCDQFSLAIRLPMNHGISHCFQLGAASANTTAHLIRACTSRSKARRPLSLLPEYTQVRASRPDAPCEDLHARAMPIVAAVIAAAATRRTFTQLSTSASTPAPNARCPITVRREPWDRLRQAGIASRAR